MKYYERAAISAVGKPSDDRSDTTDLGLPTDPRPAMWCPECGGVTTSPCHLPECPLRERSQTTVEAGARLEFSTGHLIDVHELWKGQWLYQVWPPGVETQGQFDRLIRMKAEDFEQEVASRGGKRVR